MERKELFTPIEVKFYDFSEFEYYALVVAENQENAIKGYTEIVADIEDEELVPRIITRKEALEKYKKGEIEGCEDLKTLTEDDKIALIICMRNAISMDDKINSLFKDIPFVVKEVE